MVVFGLFDLVAELWHAKALAQGGKQTMSQDDKSRDADMLQMERRPGGGGGGAGTMGGLALALALGLVLVVVLFA